ncbi:hypothetical protein T265_04037 [Opisthorchis viverrini]|uniref:Cadherin domain-containing protein n=1 Tax=Opisthorchis viverrini TaxID=6198 RepID=A0A074ZTY8_OPIVI|nr:hypothetical protein T265_04037 [Opisthorchis viverrini]KER29287.1 hypothetical protein T265_04037 [Opisthorchis viverrini]
MWLIHSSHILLKLCLLCVQLKTLTGNKVFPTVVYNLADETPADALVGNVADSLKPSLPDKIAFVLMTSQKFQYFNDFFHLSINGDLITVKHIDRDNRSEICGPLACCQLIVCQIEATILATISNDKEESGKTRNIHILETKSRKQVTIQILIRINDANDNAPQFLPVTSSPMDSNDSPEPSPFHMYIREEDVSGHETLPVAIDRDSRLNGVVEYRLIQSPSLNDLQVKPSLDVRVSNTVSQQAAAQLPLEIDDIHISTPRLVHIRPLDYENLADREIHAVLLAIDGGNPQLTGSLSIVVHLLDINDNAPVFTYNERENYITIPENSTLSNKPLYVAKATDADSGDNGRITYAFSPLTSIEATRKFAIDSVTGAIRVRMALDYEIYSERHFVLPVLAKDAGSPQRSSSMTVFVTVRDVNDNIPSLIVQENVTIPENEVVTKPVLKFYIKDEDESSHGKVSCQTANVTGELASDPELQVGSQLLRIHSVSETVFFVFTKGVLDYEKTPRVSVMIECVDLADIVENKQKPVLQPQKHQIRITAAVEDRNDNAPSFLKEKYSVNLHEHSPQGTLVVEVKAVDADSGEYGELIYELGAVTPSSGYLIRSDNFIQAFAIDPNTGRVEVLQPSLIDRELSEVMNLKVFAKDKGGLSTSTEIVVKLSDINDCAPTFSGPVEFFLEENQRVDTVVAHILCTDKDIGANGRVHLSVANAGTDVHKYIRLSPDPNFRYHDRSFNYTHKSGLMQDELVGDGEIRALLVSQMPVDREAYAALFFEIFAYDEGTPANSVTTTITIHILDENDNAPVQTFPLYDTTVGFHPPIYANSPPGTLVTRVRATDSDQGENGTVVFHIKPGTNGSELFYMNATSGELSTNWIPSKSLKNSETVRLLKIQPAEHSRLQQQTVGGHILVHQPRPGTYLLITIVSDMGVHSRRSENRFYVNINPEDPSLVDYSKANNEWSSQMTASFQNNTISVNKLLITLLIFLSSFTALSIAVAVLWTKMNKRRNSERLRKKSHIEAECKPNFSLNSSSRLRDPVLLGLQEETQNEFSKSDMYEIQQEEDFANQQSKITPPVYPIFTGSLHAKTSGMFDGFFESNSLTNCSSPNLRCITGSDGSGQQDFCGFQRSKPSCGFLQHRGAYLSATSEQNFSLSGNPLTPYSPGGVGAYEYGSSNISPLIQNLNVLRSEPVSHVANASFDGAYSFGQYVQADCRESLPIFPGPTYPTVTYSENSIFGSHWSGR